MEEFFAKNLTHTLKIGLEQIVREEYEMICLKKIFESPLGKKLIFKGGTALRLSYQSPRFSDDLDFSAKGKIRPAELKQILLDLCSQFPQAKLEEFYSKKFTIFALLRIKEAFMNYSFSLKLEISTRPEDWKINKNFILKVISSDTSNISVLSQTASLEHVLQDKYDALKRRKKPRDFFDIWYVSQLLKKNATLDFSQIDKKQLIQELHKYLPRNYWRVIESWKK